jgi:hypothetical protein
MERSCELLAMSGEHYPGISNYYYGIHNYDSVPSGAKALLKMFKAIFKVPHRGYTLDAQHLEGNRDAGLILLHGLGYKAFIPMGYFV